MENKVLVSTGLSAPSWDFVSTTYVSGNDYVAGDSIMYLDTSSGTSETLYTDMSSILSQHVGSTGGIVISGNIMATDISELAPVSSFNTDDFVLAVNNPTIASPLDEQIGVSAFIGNFAGSGLIASGSQLAVDTENVFLYAYGTELTISGDPDEGRIVYVIDGGGSVPALAVGDGSVWLKVTLGSF